MGNTHGMYSDNRLPWELSELRNQPAFTSSKENPSSTYPGEESPPVVERHFICHSSRDDGYSRLVGAGFSGTGDMGNETARQRSRIHLGVKSHKNLDVISGVTI
jgi:hypothetical protein